MKKTRTLKALMLSSALACAATAGAQVVAADSVLQDHDNHDSRLTVGGYGEVALSREFFSDSKTRYSKPANYKNDPSHGRFDIPHAVIYLGYDFGHGWTMGTEIEFEHTGTGGAIESEYEEAGEWEQETEKGGEVELEQFWIQKSFASWLNVKVGHFVVPVGMNNAYHEPLNYFTVYRPEGENTILPSTWHDTGISLWGRAGRLRYEAQVVAGLNAMFFNTTGWIHAGAGSPFEFKTANTLGFAARVDWYAINGLRLGLSGYYGQSVHNTYPLDTKGTSVITGKPKPYDDVKGTVAIGSADMTLKRWNWIVRAQATYGYLGDTDKINLLKDAKAHASDSPVKGAPVAKNAVAMSVEAGYDVFSQISSLRQRQQQLYVFGRYEYYDSYIPTGNKAMYDYTDVKRFAVGLNYHPLPEVVVKLDYSKRLLKSPYNNEPALSLGVAYEGWFL